MTPRATHPALRTAALAAALAGCAGAGARPVRHEVSIQAFVYQPASQPVRPGDTLVFINHDAVPHTATAADKRWDSGEIPANATRTVVVPGNGAGPYKCLFHPNMAGTLTAAE